MSGTGHRPADAIAIVGIGCRFPGGITDPASFWQLLAEGGDAITEVPASRFDLARFFDARPATPGRTMSRFGGFVEPIESFDAAFFGIAPREAERVDPQQRLWLEAAWESLEDAGIDAPALEGSATGVFVGQWLSDFESRLFSDPEQVDFYMTTGSGRYATSGRLSYLLGLRGPSLTVDTACSSSLVSVHLAVRSLRAGECTLALAGGVNVILQPHVSVAYSQSRMMAPDGRCKFGDAGGDGYVRSDGAGVVVLKPLASATADGDRIYAVIRGSAVNNDGRSSGSMGTPSRQGQEALLRSAYADAGVDPRSVQYVEAHGTGTRAGDPVELGALAAVLGFERLPDQPLLVGSVKSNIGHTEGAAGVAGLIKSALAMHNGTIPASLHFKQPNPRVPWADWPLRIPAAACPWPAVGEPRIAGVSAFGIAGTNAHVVLEAAPAAGPPVPPPRRQDRPWLYAISARSAQALAAVAARHAELLQALPAAQMQDACWSACTRRGALEQRAAFVASDGAALVDELRRYAHDSADRGPGAFTGAAYAEAPARVVFVCPGQGGQWLGMARELLRRQGAFRQALQRCDAAARPYLGESLIQLLESAPEATLQRIDRVQPLLVALAISWGEALRAAGIQPDAVVGHSMGEVASAQLAGVLSLEQAMRIVCRRSALMAATSGQGAMALVDLPADQMAERLRAASPALGEQVSVAVVNSPRSCVVSGEAGAVNRLLEALQAEQVFCRAIQVDVASHSPQMDAPAAALAAELADLRATDGHTPWYSTVRAAPLPGTQADASYWARNLRQPVRFGDTIARLAADGMTVFVELGPHPVLRPSIEQNGEAIGTALSALCVGHRDDGDDVAWHRLLGRLWTLGVQPNWRAVLGPGRYVPLPTYPWQRERHWGEAAQRLAGSSPAAAVDAMPGRADGAARRHPLLQRRFDAAASAGISTTLWETWLSAERHALYQEHRVRDSAWLPGAAMVEAVLSAVREARPGTAWALEEVQFDRALPLAAAGGVRLQLRIDWTGPTQGRFELQTVPAGGSEGTVHCHGRVRADAVAAAEAGRAAKPGPRGPGGPGGAGGAEEVLEAAAIYELLEQAGLPYGPAFRCIETMHVPPAPDVGLPASESGAADSPHGARLYADPAAADPHAADHHAYPPLLDAALQTLLAATLLAHPERRGTLHVPVAIAHIALHRPMQPGEHLRLEFWPAGGRLRVCGADGSTLATADGVRFAEVGSSRPTLSSLLHTMQWLPVADAPAAVARSAAQSNPAATTASGGTPSPWLVIGGSTPQASPLVEALRASGAAVLWIDDAAASEGGLQQAWQSLNASAPTARVQVLSLGDLRGAAQPSIDRAAIEGAWHAAIARTRDLARALAEASPAPGLWFITQGAVAVGDEAGLSFAQGAFWGLGRVLAHEQPRFDTRLVDLDPRQTPDRQVAALVTRLSAPPPERQLALRDGRWFAPRLAAFDGDMVAPVRPAPVANWCAAIGEPGAPQTLHWQQAWRPAPGPDEVEVEVDAAGLNFLDLLSALAALPGAAEAARPLGLECAGRVSRVGRGVQDLAPGDPVVAICAGSLRRHALAHASLVQRLPPGLSLSDAAGLPIAFATVWHSLGDLARLEPGETVLVHSAAGGVGLAALQVVQHLGGHVIATAGTPEKRAWLREQGVARVFDSRNNTFADEVLAATGGRGVDVVLNALAGEAIEAGLRCLATGGRFIEMGKRDIYGGSAMPLTHFRKSLGYFAVDLESMLRERPERLARIQREVMQRFATGQFKPLPVRRYAADALADAFRDLMPGTHIGKHVVNLSAPPTEVSRTEGGHTPIRAEACYLVTGGLGALGLRLAHWLAERGAGRIVLVGRRAPDDVTLQRISAMQALGATVDVERCDVADASDFGALLQRLRASGPPLRGVLHAAGVLDDALVTDLDPARSLAVRNPKVLGAWHIDQLTAGDTLDFVVWLSSVASLLGTPGQGAYAAANAVLDALAHHRQARGLRTLSVNLGPVRGEGMAAQQRLRGDSLARLGLAGIDAEQVVHAIDTLLASGASQAACIRLDAAQWHAATVREGAVDLVPAVSGTAATGEVTPAAGTAGTQAHEPALRERLAAAPPGQPRRGLMETLLREEVGQVLRIAAARVPADRPLRALGLDSLMALELRSRLERRTGLALSPTLAWNHPTVALLGAHLAERLGVPLDAAAAPAPDRTDHADSAPAAPPAPADPADPAAGEVDALLAALQSLSAEETAHLLAATETPAR